MYIPKYDPGGIAHNLRFLYTVAFYVISHRLLALYFPWRNSLWWARASLLSRLHHHSQDFSVRMISAKQRPFLDDTQHPQGTYIHVPSEIRTRSRNKRASADSRLRRRDQRDRRTLA
jgi:hypothetical protein